jgi:asparagine synthase (glutamine-hydrolysing)
VCGIAGYIGPERVDEARQNACLALMHRRGPDAKGSYRHLEGGGRHVLLIHSRLSIIDLDPRAHQPYHQDGRSLVFNGEIYNYVELAQQLKAKGQPLQTRSDTEVLFSMLGAEGVASLDKCEGMWAFAYYDEMRECLWLSRDRFGEKPLYVFEDATGLYFGSEVKYIQALRRSPLKPNRKQLYRQLINGYKSLYKSGETFFEGVYEIPPAQVWAFKAGRKADKQSYWSSSFQPDDTMSRQEAVAGARKALLRAMEIRLRSDVPLAFCLSGGVDSNSLVSIAKRLFDYDVHGFTIMNTDARYDERELVEESVRELSIRHTPIPVETTDFLPRLRELVRQHDAPVVTITYYAQWLLMKKVAEAGYKISISGTGADEVFSGYYDHHLAYLRDIQHEKELFDVSLNFWTTHIQPIVRNPHLQRHDLFIDKPMHRDHIFMRNEEFADYLYEDWFEPFTEKNWCSCEHLLRCRMLNEIREETVPPILHEDDLNAMYYSIENRSPFLDRELFEYSMSIPTRHLIHRGYAKSILREALGDILPPAVRDERRKVGFNAPLFSYLDVGNPAVRGQVLDDSPIYDLVKRERIEALLQKDALPNSESKFLFSFINAKIFLEEFGS